MLDREYMYSYRISLNSSKIVFLLKNYIILGGSVNISALKSIERTICTMRIFQGQLVLIGKGGQGHCLTVLSDSINCRGKSPSIVVDFKCLQFNSPSCSRMATIFLPSSGIAASLATVVPHVSDIRFAPIIIGEFHVSLQFRPVGSLVAPSTGQGYFKQVMKTRKDRPKVREAYERIGCPLSPFPFPFAAKPRPIAIRF